MAGKLFVVSACSGAGKTTLVTQAIDELSNSCPIGRVITYTTKTPRATEQNGVDYYFLSVEEFEIRIKNGFFLEWSNHYGHYYGSPHSIITEIAQGTSLVIIADLSGAQAIKNVVNDAVLIWIYTDSLDQLKQRLLLRKTENNEEIKKRLLIAQQELEEQKTLSVFNYSILNNEHQKALSELINIIVKNINLA